MTEIFIKEKTLPLAYHAALVALEQQGDIITCNDYIAMPL